MQDMVVNDEITVGARLAAQYGNCRDAVIAESAKRSEVTRMLAADYDASNYAWRSDGRVGNTLTEIHEIKAYGHPLPKSKNSISGEMHFRGFQYENEDGFLKGSHPYTIKKNEDVEDYDPIDFLYAEPQSVQEKYLQEGSYSEVVHNQYGRGFLLDRTDVLSKVYFMQLPGSTPSCHHGANIRWVKTSNLL